MQSREKKLIERIIRKDEKALLEVHRLYKKSIFRFVYRKLNDYQEAEEITQDTFFDFIEHLRDFRGDSSLKTFIFSIAKHKAIDAIRKRKIKKVLFSAFPEHIVERFVTVFFDDEIEKKELAEKIQKVFDKLPNDYRVILRLKYIEQVKVKKIAKKLRLSFKAAESLLFRARRAFVALWEQVS